MEVDLDTRQEQDRRYEGRENPSPETGERRFQASTPFLRSIASVIVLKTRSAQKAPTPIAV